MSLGCLYTFFCETQHIRHFSVSGKEVSCPMSICCCAHLWSERRGLVHVHWSTHHGSLLMACWRWHTSLVSRLWDSGNAQLCLCSTRRPPWRCLLVPANTSLCCPGVGQAVSRATYLNVVFLVEEVWWMQLKYFYSQNSSSLSLPLVTKSEQIRSISATFNAAQCRFVPFSPTWPGPR